MLKGFTRCSGSMFSAFLLALGVLLNSQSVVAQLTIESTVSMQIAGCAGAGLLGPDSSTVPSTFTGVPAEFVFRGDSNAVIQVSFSLPPQLQNLDGGMASVGPFTGKDQSTGLTFNPALSNMFSLGASGELHLTLGMAFTSIRSYTSPQYSGQLLVTADYVGGRAPESPESGKERTSAAEVLGAIMLFNAMCPCDSSLMQNGSFLLGNNPGVMPSPGQITSWGRAYGSPVVVADSGCDDLGYLRLHGGKRQGDAIFQTLNPGNPIVSTRRYLLSFCARYSPAPDDAGYVKYRAYAFNGTPPSGPEHPVPTQLAGSPILYLGESGRIQTTEWANVEFNIWMANKDFESIAISVETADTLLSSYGEIDNICFIEVTDTVPCYLATVDTSGAFVLPENAEIEDASPSDEEVFNGNLFDLYGNACPEVADGTSMWYESCELPCANIGGEIPDSALIVREQIEGYLLDSLGIDLTLQQFDSLVQANDDSILTALSQNPDEFGPPDVGPITVLCDSVMGPDTFDAGSAFDGYDIVFVHGFMNSKVFMEGLSNANSPAVTKKWPDNKAEFVEDGKFFKVQAERYWRGAIEHFLKNGDQHLSPSKNRYLIVSWNTNQRLRFAAHAVLQQVADAMGPQHVGVMDAETMLPSVNPAGFGKRGIVYISHSTGGLVTDVALSWARKSADGSDGGKMRSKLGNLSFIYDASRAHVGLHDAFSGSRMASISLLILSAAGALSLGELGEMLFPGATTGVALWNYAYSGVLVDLVPLVAQLRWQAFERSGIPTLAIAGGHPGKFADAELNILVKNIIHPGFDDGVLNMESQCAQNFFPESAVFWPNGFIPEKFLGIAFPVFNPSVYDMGIPNARAIGFHMDKTVDPILWGAVGGVGGLRASCGCTPYLTPNGMLEKVKTPYWDLPFLPNMPSIVTSILQELNIPTSLRITPVSRYDDHHSFLQAPSNHDASTLPQALNEPNPYGLAPFNTPYRYKDGYGRINDEEVNGIIDESIYSMRPHHQDAGRSEFVVNSNFKYQQGEWVKGYPPLSIRIKIPFIKKPFIFGPYFLWKRTYHRMINFSQLHEMHYVFKYLLKQ